MSGSSYPDGGRGLPRVAYGDPAAGARALVEAISALIADAEALGVVEVVDRLTLALKAAERRAAGDIERLEP